jgi:hypothetical protein
MRDFLGTYLATGDASLISMAICFASITCNGYVILMWFTRVDKKQN